MNTIIGWNQELVDNILCSWILKLMNKFEIDDIDIFYADLANLEVDEKKCKSVIFQEIKKVLENEAKLKVVIYEEKDTDVETIREIAKNLLFVSKWISNLIAKVPYNNWSSVNGLYLVLARSDSSDLICERNNIDLNVFFNVLFSEYKKLGGQNIPIPNGSKNNIIRYLAQILLEEIEK